jgi:plastocyanin
LAALCVAVLSGFGAIHTVNVGPGSSFSPSSITINVGDTVNWPSVGSFHTVTGYSPPSEPFCGSGPPPGGSCSVTFQVAGTYNYRCVFHSFASGGGFVGMVGVVNVAGAPSVPPVVSITNPPNNALFLAPAMVTVGVSATDSDGTIANVRLLTNDVAAATNNVAPFGFVLSNLGVGNYALRARAIDSQQLVTTSAVVNVRVAAQPFLSFQTGSNGPIQFQFNTLAGVNYVVERAEPLTNFSSVVTNPGSGGAVQFSETNSGPSQRTYRIRLQ